MDDFHLRPLFGALFGCHLEEDQLIVRDSTFDILWKIYEKLFIWFVRHSILAQ